MNRIAAFLVLGMSLAWSIRLHDFFYESTQADFTALILIAALTFSLSMAFAPSLKTTSAVLLSLFVFALPLAMYPLINYFITTGHWSHLLIYLLVAITAFSVVTLVRSRLILALPVPYLVILLLPFSFQRDQQKFHDRLNARLETRTGSMKQANWKNHSWVYYNGQLQYSTMDKHIYQEAYVHPVMQLVTGSTSSVLVIGGENGLVLEELNKYDSVKKITWLPQDSEYCQHTVKTKGIKPGGSLSIAKTDDLFRYLSLNTLKKYDLIIMDLPDPSNIFTKQHYSKEFYTLCEQTLNSEGLIVTQSGDLYKDGSAVQRIQNTVEAGGFFILPYHCQIPTIGQWSWVIGSKTQDRAAMKLALSNAEEKVETTWWSPEAMQMMLAFGKWFFSNPSDEVYSLQK